MKISFTKWKELFHDPKLRNSLLVSLLFLFISLIINYYAALYASERISNYVTDIVLSNIPVFDVDMIFVYGPVIFWALISLACIYDPKKTPFMLKNIAMFVIVRSVFITLTHLGPFPDHNVIPFTGPGALKAISLFSAGGDLFFSGHTGLPYLMALVFWNHHVVRWLCIGTSIFFGVIVLLGHLHYSIDVMAAFFITYTIYHITKKLFPEDCAAFGV